jgi:AbiV family abortive infection protein
MIEMCLLNSTQFLADANLIHSHNKRSKYDHSIASVQFAVEEFGKASILRKKLQESEEDVIEVPYKLFGGRGSHQLKDNEAWTILSPELRVLARKAFEPDCFDPRFFVTNDVELSHEERLQCLFVDFKDDVPTLGVVVESDNFLKLLKGIEEEIDRFRSFRS